MLLPPLRPALLLQNDDVLCCPWSMERESGDDPDVMPAMARVGGAPKERDVVVTLSTVSLSCVRWRWMLSGSLRSSVATLTVAEMVGERLGSSASSAVTAPPLAWVGDAA